MTAGRPRTWLVRGRRHAPPRSGSDEVPGGVLLGPERFWVPATLGLSFLANDGEELLTMAEGARRALGRLPAWAPRPRIGQRHVTVGIGVMGVLVAGAVADGWRTAGRGRFYQSVQLVYGLHGLGHLVASLATAGYTSGVVTSPTVVLPQLAWATGRLRRSGIADAADLRFGVAVMGPWLLGAHLAGALAQQRLDRRRLDRGRLDLR